MPKPPKHSKKQPAAPAAPATIDSILTAVGALRGELADLTPLLEAQRDLRAAERRFAAFEIGPIGLWHAGPDGETFLANQAMATLLDASGPDELLQHRLDELIDPAVLTPGSLREVELTGPGGRRHAMISTVEVDGGGAGHLHAFVDVTALRGTASSTPVSPTAPAAAAAPPVDPKLAERLGVAVANNELILHYQPVLDISRGLMIGAEALLRWQHPKRGLITAAEFIGPAEQAGLLPDISRWVIAEACRQSVEWREHDIMMGVSINLPLILTDASIVDSLRDHVASTGLRASGFMIEITEAAIMTDPDRSQNILAELSREGFRLAIDDFGTGYSSLARLRKLPVSALKIDRSFITDLPDDRDAGTVVKTVIQLAANLGLVAIAEGIENEQQLSFLTTHGCHLGQGYLLSPAIAGASIPELYRRCERAAAGDA